MSVPICSEVSRNSGQNHRDGTRARVRESGHVPSRFPSRDAPAERPDLPMRCLETRQRNGMKWRRYRTAEGVIVTTYEVPCEVVRCLGQARLQAELQRAARQQERAARNARALALLAEGWKPLAVGGEVGLCEAQVRRLRQKAQSTRSRSRVSSAKVTP